MSCCTLTLRLLLATRGETYPLPTKPFSISSSLAQATQSLQQHSRLHNPPRSDLSLEAMAGTFHPSFSNHTPALTFGSIGHAARYRWSRLSTSECLIKPRYPFSTCGVTLGPHSKTSPPEMRNALQSATCISICGQQALTAIEVAGEHLAEAKSLKVDSGGVV